MPRPFPLHFTRYRQLASDVAARLESSKSHDPLRPWAAEVIVASGGVSAAIARDVAATNPGGFAALQLQSIDTFVRRVVNAGGEFPRVAADAERRLAMRAAIRSIDDPITQSRGIGSMLERSYRDMRDSGLTLAEFRKRSQRAALRNPGRTRLVIQAWTEYERLIARLGAVDAADLFSRAAQLIRAGAPVARQIVAGFYDLTGAQRSVVEALAERERLEAVHVPILPGDNYEFARPLIAALAKMGGEVEPTAKIEIREPAIALAEFERRDSEMRGVCEDVAELLAKGVAPESIGIVARTLDESDLDLFNRFAAAHGFATTASEELPLIAHRIGRATAAILQLRDDDFPRSSVLEIVRDGFKARTHINVDRADEVTRRLRISGGSSAGLRVRDDKPLVVGDYIELVQELETMTAPLAASTLRGGHWAEFIETIASRFSATTPSDLAALERLQEIAATFARADRLDVRFDAAAVLDAIEQATIPALRIADCELRIDGDSAPTSADSIRNPQSAIRNLPTLFLGDVMRFRGRSFEHLFAVRMQDEILPQRRIEDPLVPDADRRRLGIREIGDGRDEERLLFQLILDGASSIHFSFAATDGFGKVLRPSQLLKNLVIERQPERKSELLEKFSTVCTPERSRPARAPRLPRNEATLNRQLQLIAQHGKNGPFDGFIGDAALLERFTARLRQTSPTRLEDFGECPQKFLLKNILGVHDVDDPDHDLQIDRRDKGTLDHQIMESFYRELGDVQFAEAQAHLPALPAAIAERLETIVDAAFDALEREAPAFNRTIREIERRTTKSNLRDFVAGDLDDLAQSALRPRWFEYSFGPKYEDRADHPAPFTITANGIAIDVDGQIDRIDVAEGPQYRIVDYKSGKALRHKKLAKKIEQGLRLQLAIYAMAVADFFGADPENVRGAIKPLAGGDAKSFSFRLADIRGSLQQALETFIGAIRSGRFPAVPEEESCKYCPVNLSCRTKHDPDEVYALKNLDPLTLLQSLGEKR